LDEEWSLAGPEDEGSVLSGGVWWFLLGYIVVVGFIVISIVLSL
jgi:hypothetical protein